MSDEKEREERHGQGWTVEEEQQLYDAFVAGDSVGEIAAEHQRSAGGIRAALKKIGLMDEDGRRVVPTPEFAASEAAQKRSEKKRALQKALERQRAADDLPAPEMNGQFVAAIERMENAPGPLFITGKAGTGKSTLLSYFVRTTEKKLVVLAPTGVAALNVKGQTIHSFFNFPVDVTVSAITSHKTKPRNVKLYKKLDTVVIDEISMVRADLLDCIDACLRQYGPKAGQPFGGVQMIFLGDLYQLPPVVNGAAAELFRTHYQTPYFFSAHCLEGVEVERIELQKIYRQTDRDFIDLLGRIRGNTVTPADIAHINSRVGATVAAGKGEFRITLASTNKTADEINEDSLSDLAGRLYTNEAKITGDFSKEYYPTAPTLSFKLGAQVMMLNNDMEKRWVNGSLGMIDDLCRDEAGDEYLSVKLQDGGRIVQVYPYTWEVVRFRLEENEIVAAPIGTFAQYPFRLAWAITIHKSQGKTFSRVTVDLGRGAFAAGQVYVALSRCTSFEGLSLNSPIRASDIRTDPQIAGFMGAGDEPEEDDGLTAIIRQAIARGALLDVVYQKADGAETALTIRPKALARASYQGEMYLGLRAEHDGVDRLLRVDKILQINAVGGQNAA